MSEEMAKKYVSEGAKWLDSDESGAPKDWRAQIDMEDLSMYDGARCILGQLFTVYAEDGRVRSSGYTQVASKVAETNLAVNQFMLYAEDGRVRSSGYTQVASKVAETLAVNQFMLDHGFCPRGDAGAWELCKAWAVEIQKAA